MTGSLADYFLSAGRLGHDGNQISHTPGRDKQSGLAVENFRSSSLQPIDRRVLEVNVIADLGIRHGAAHRGRGLRYSVTAEINDSVVHRFLAHLEVEQRRR